jgi:hypothetical protein
MRSVPGLAPIVLVIFGLLQLFFGYRLFRILIGILGAVIGFFYAPEIVAMVTGAAPSTAVALVIGAGVAVAFALVAWYVFWAAVFVWGATVGYAAGVATTGGQAWLALLIALVVGGLAVLFQRVLIVLLASLNGAWLVVSGGAFIFGQLARAPRGLAFDPLPDIGAPVSIWLVVATLALAVVGAVYQFRDSKPMLGHKR